MTIVNRRVGHGTITTDTQTDEFVCNGWATLSAHLDSGSGTWTWQFKGIDGVWRSIYAGSDFITEMAFTASNMINIFFGTDVDFKIFFPTDPGILCFDFKIKIVEW